MAAIPAPPNPLQSRQLRIAQGHARVAFLLAVPGGTGLLIVDIETRLILNDRVLAFPSGQGTPEAILQAAFELGKRSALARVDANPFLNGKRRSLIRPEPHHGAEAVAWLRGHYLTRLAIQSGEVIEIGKAIEIEASIEIEETIEFKQAA